MGSTAPAATGGVEGGVMCGTAAAGAAALSWSPNLLAVGPGLAAGPLEAEAEAAGRRAEGGSPSPGLVKFGAKLIGELSEREPDMALCA
eukprot:3932327-Alexandrium_andersonii.AAC.1